jgi:hypothetical protein
MPELSSADWDRVDSFLAQSQVLNAVVLFRELTGCEIGDAKAAVGERFRVRFPEIFRDYRNIGGDD